MMQRPEVARLAAVALAAILGIVATAPPASAVEPGEGGALKRWFFPGDSVVLILKDSTRVAGEFHGLSRTRLEDYRLRYDQWRGSDPDASRMPALGARVELVGLGMSNFAEGSFWGFSQDGVELQKKHNMPVGPVEFARFTHLVVPRDGTVKRSQLERWSKARALPLVTEVVVMTAEGPRTIALDDVAGSKATGFGAVPVELGRFVDRIVPVYATALEVGSSRFFGRNGGDLSLRLFPMLPGALGADVAIGYVRFEPGWLSTWDLDAAVTVPLGKRAGLEPRIGGGLLFGDGWAAFSGNIGAGMFVLVTPRVGVRADYGSRFALLGLVGEGVPFAIHLGLFVANR